LESGRRRPGFVSDYVEFSDPLLYKMRKAEEPRGALPPELAGKKSTREETENRSGRGLHSPKGGRIRRCVFSRWGDCLLRKTGELIRARGPQAKGDIPRKVRKKKEGTNCFETIRHRLIDVPVIGDLARPRGTKPKG